MTERKVKVADTSRQLMTETKVKVADTSGLLMTKTIVKVADTSGLGYQSISFVGFFCIKEDYITCLSSILQIFANYRVQHINYYHIGYLIRSIREP